MAEMPSILLRPPERCLDSGQVTSDDRPMGRLSEVWSVLREPLTSTLSFAQMKEVAGGAGLPTAKLSHLRQGTSGSGGGTSKAGLADALDGLFNELSPEQQDRVTGHLIAELVARSGDDGIERLEELLERAGWHLVGGEPAPLTLNAPPPVVPLPKAVQEAIGKSVRRFRDGDFDGAMTSIVGLVDTMTGDIYTASGLPDHKRTSYHQRAVTAHKELETAFRSQLGSMSTAEQDLSWEGQKRAVNGTAELLAAFRRNYSDAHGASAADPKLVQDALQAALFLVACLQD